MKSRFWDTNLLIYLIEQCLNLHLMVGRIRRDMLKSNELLVTSTLTLGEVLVRPKRLCRYDQYPL